jgi:hypothetical protein
MGVMDSLHSPAWIRLDEHSQLQWTQQRMKPAGDLLIQQVPTGQGIKKA